MCNNCGSKSLTRKCDRRLVTKLLFKEEDGKNITLNLPHHILEEFAASLSCNIENDDEISSLEEALLSDETCNFEYDLKTYTIHKLTH